MKKRKIIIFSIIAIFLTGCSESKEQKLVCMDNSESFLQEEIQEETIKEKIIDEENNSKEEYVNFDYDNINIDSYISLGEYKHVINTPDISVTEEELQQEIEYYLESYSIDNDKIINGIIKDGDKINVHYTIKTDDSEQVYNDCNIYIGYEMIAPGIDEKLIGQSVGNIQTYSITYPQNYIDSSLAGKNASIKITINHILGDSIKSEWNDEFVSLLTNNEYSDTSSYEEVLKEEILKNKKNEYYLEILDKVVENSTITGDIKDMVNDEYQKYLSEFNTYLEIYQINKEEAASNFGFENFDEYEKLLKQYAEDSVKQKLVIYKIAKDYDIKITTAEYSEYINELKDYYSEEEINELFSEDYSKYVLLYEKTMEKLLELQF